MADAAEWDRNSPVSKLYLTQRVTWLASRASLESLMEFVLERELSLLLRLLLLHFNVHTVTKGPFLVPSSSTAAQLSVLDLVPMAAVSAPHGSGAAVDARAATYELTASTPPATRPTASRAAGNSNGVNATRESLLHATDSPHSGSEVALDALWCQPRGAEADTGVARDETPGSCSCGMGTMDLQPGGTFEGLPAPAKPTSVDRMALSAAVSPAMRRPTVSVCRLLMRNSRHRYGGIDTSLSSFDLSSCLGYAACGRCDGAIDLVRTSRAMALESCPSPQPKVASPLPSAVLHGHSGPVYNVTFSSGSQYALSASQDGDVRLWSVELARCLVSYCSHSAPVWKVGFSPHNSQFLSCCYDGTLRIFATERPLPLRVLAGHLADVTDGCFHPNGTCALTSSRDGTMRLWDIDSGGCVRVFTTHSAPIYAVSVSPDGQLAASGGEDRTVKLWHIATGQLLHSLPPQPDGVGSVVFNPSGKLIASVACRRVEMWELKDVASSIPEALVTIESPAPVLSTGFILGSLELAVMVAGVEVSPR